MNDIDILLDAIETRKLDKVKSLIEANKLDINIKDGLLLIKACQVNDFKIAQYLIDNGADVNAKNHAPLQYALYNRAIPLIDYLVKKGAELNMDDPDTILFSQILINKYSTDK